MTNLNKGIKIFFIDLDGTLLDIKGSHTHNISEENIKAIKEAQKNGVHVVVSTGRSGSQAEKYLKLIDYKYAVTGNGSIILNGNKIVREIKMSLRQSLLIIDFAKKHGLVMKVDDSRVGYGAFKWIQSFITSKMNFNPVKHFNLEMHREYHKIVLWGKTKKKMKNLAELLSKEVEGISIVSSGNGWTLELSHESATKGSGNLYVAEKFFGITNKNEMAHIGDSMNDSTVVKDMRLIAMKNSDKNLKALTKYIGPHYKRAGVAKVLKGNYKKIDK